MPASPARDQQELTLQIALGAPLIITRGYGVPEVAKVYTRARKLYEQLGDAPQLLPNSSLSGGFISCGAPTKSRMKWRNAFLGWCRTYTNPALLLPGQLALGSTFFRLGDFVTARDHLEQGVVSYDLQRHRLSRVEAALYGAEPGVMVRAYSAWVLCHLGYVDQALQRSQEAVALAHELSHPFSLAYALQFAATVHRLRREAHAAQERAEAVIALASEHGFPYWAAAGTFVRGWALAEQGQLVEGKRQMRHSIDAWRAIGIQTFGQPYVMLAEVCGKMGEVDEGFGLLAEALAEVRQSGERWWEAELYRVKGELGLYQSHTQGREVSVTNSRPPILPAHTEAEADFGKALNIARHQNAKWLELRVGLRLSRLWLQWGRKRGGAAITYGTL